MKLAALQQAGLVGAGGFIGSILRFAVGGLVQRVWPAATFPWGTLTVNLLGCFAIGLLTGLAEIRQLLGPSVRPFLLLGLLGGFTTFSTFGYETMALVRDAQHVRAAGNVLLHVGLGLAAVWLGQALARAG